VCEPPLTDCNGQCVDLLGDSGNCGACGNACAETAHCGQGFCVCNDNPRRFKSCSGVCVRIYNDPLNCGDCGVRCGPEQRCRQGRCAPRRR
jgi:hypothetical protein